MRASAPHIGRHVLASMVAVTRPMSPVVLSCLTGFMAWLNSYYELKESLWLIYFLVFLDEESHKHEGYLGSNHGMQTCGSKHGEVNYHSSSRTVCR